MANEPISFEEAVKIRLKSMVAELIPEERWDGIVQQTITDFIGKDLPQLIKKELEEHFRAKIKEALYSPDFYSASWQDGQLVATEMIKSLIEKQAPSILAAMIGSIIQQQVMSMQNIRY